MNGTVTATVEMIEFYYTPVLVLLGTIGNLLAVYVFLSTKLRKLSSSYYLSALALSDTGFLITLLLVWFRLAFEINILNQPIACPVMNYSSYVCSFLSVWLVVAFTVERFVAVSYPLLRQSLCTVKRAKIMVLILTVIALIFCSPLLLLARVNKDHLCNYEPGSENLIYIFNLLDTIITYAIPVLFIIILNTCISRTVWRLASVRKRLTQRLPDGNTTTSTRTKRHTFRHKNGPMSQHKVTKMLLIVSTTFLCLNLPSYVLRVITHLIEMDIITVQNITPLMEVQHYFLILFNTNFGINFALYCISGQNFRKAAAKSLYCIVKRRNSNEAVALTESRTQSTVSTGVTSKRRRIPSSHIRNTDINETTSLRIKNGVNKYQNVTP